MINLANRAARLREWAAQLRLRRAVERGFAASLKREFTRTAGEAVVAYRNGLSNDSVIAEHAKRVDLILFSLYVSVARASVSRLLSRIKKDNPEVLEEKAYKDTESAIGAFAKRWSGSRVKSISQHTRTRINKAIQNGLKNGETLSEISKAIVSKTGGKIGEWRASVIARTEVHTASQQGALEAVASTGIPFKKEWVSVEDDRTREDHGDVNGEEVGLHEKFSVGDSELAYPGDPNGDAEQVINCRCIVVFNDPG